MGKNIWRTSRGELCLLVLILLLGAFLRLFQLGKYPNGLNPEEARLGYRAGALLQFHKDEWNRSPSLIFTSFEDYQLPLPTYIILPLAKIFGLSQSIVRMPFAIMGIFALIFFFGALISLYPDRRMALWATFLLAVNPWGVFVSRIVSPEGLSFSLFLIGLFFLLKNKKVLYLLIASIFLALSLYSSKVAWFFLPPFLVYRCLSRPNIKEKTRIIFLIISVIIFTLPLFISYFRLPSVKQSLLDNDFSYFSDKSIESGINQMRGTELRVGFPWLGRLFYNKSFYAIKLIDNFFRHFSLRFFFAAGDGDPLHGFSNFGPFFLILLPFTLWGIKLAAKKDGNNKLLFVWFAISIFPSLLVQTSPSQDRFLFVVPVILILASLGISNISKWPFKAIFLILILANFTLVYYDFLTEEPIRSQKQWPQYWKQFSLLIKEKSSQFDAVYLSDGYISDPGPLLLYFWQYPYQDWFGDSEVDKHFNYRFWINAVGNVQIGGFDKLKINLEKRIFLIMTEQEAKEFIHKPEVIKYFSNETKTNCYAINNEKGLTDAAGKVIFVFASISKENCLLPGKIL